MTMATDAAGLLPAENRLHSRQSVWRGLFWHEWFSHGSQMLTVLSIWLVGQWILEIFNNPGFVIFGGIAMGMWLGIVFGGSDAMEATEEFTIALPARRSQRYFVRLLISLSYLVLLVAISLLAIHLNWPQAVWSLFVETGFTAPFPRISAEWEGIALYLMGISCPLAAYGVTFGFASMATSRDQVSMGAGLGLVYSGAAFWIGLAIESWWYHAVQHNDTLIVVFAIQVLMALSMLVAGFFGYVRKDGISRPRGFGSPEWRMTFIVSSGLVVLLLLVIVAVAYIEASR